MGLDDIRLIEPAVRSGPVGHEWSLLGAGPYRAYVASAYERGLAHPRLFELWGAPTDALSRQVAALRGF